MILFEQDSLSLSLFEFYLAFINMLSIREVVAVVMLLVVLTAYGQTNELPRSTPEAVGVRSAEVEALFDSLMALDATEIHSVMVTRRGRVIGEIYPRPFSAEYRHTMYSCSKTFVAAAVGIAIDENRLRLSDRVASFFPECLPERISPELADMTVEDLLTMRSGITPDWNMRSRTSEWIGTFLKKPVAEPGEVFQYDSMATYMLSAIVQRVTGMTLLDYLRLKLFTLMNISQVGWEMSPEGINTGGWGLHIQSESLAKFGLLLMNRGVWNGHRLISEEWIDAMTTKKVDVKNGDDYGYQTWMCKYPGAFRADGALGQYIIVIPEKDLVMVITECTRLDGGRQRELFFNFASQVGDIALAESADYKRLQRKQQSYELPVVSGTKDSKLLRELVGKTIALEPNKLGWQSISCNAERDGMTLSVTDSVGRKENIRLGYREWITSRLVAYPPYSITPIDRFKGLDANFMVAGSYACQDDERVRLKLHYVNWVSSLDIIIYKEGDGYVVEIQENYSNQPIKARGKAQNLTEFFGRHKNIKT